MSYVEKNSLWAVSRPSLVCVLFSPACTNCRYKCAHQRYRQEKYTLKDYINLFSFFLSLCGLFSTITGRTTLSFITDPFLPPCQLANCFVGVLRRLTAASSPAPSAASGSWTPSVPWPWFSPWSSPWSLPWSSPWSWSCPAGGGRAAPWPLGSTCWM